MPELIYCADGNKRFAEIAIDAGFTYGAQPYRTTYFPIDFADVHPANVPPLDKYAAAIERHAPRLATVMDWERYEQLEDVLVWAETIAPFVETIIVIPKVMGGVPHIPRSIGNKPVRLGYSVPTRHGGSSLPVWEFAGRPVHLLGGSPQKQIELAHYLNVVSADGNMAQLMATRYCQFWQPGTARYASNRWWPTLREAEGSLWRDGADDAIYEAFARSCASIMQFWRNITHDKF